MNLWTHQSCFIHTDGLSRAPKFDHNRQRGMREDEMFQCQKFHTGGRSNRWLPTQMCDHPKLVLQNSHVTKSDAIFHHERLCCLHELKKRSQLWLACPCADFISVSVKKEQFLLFFLLCVCFEDGSPTGSLNKHKICWEFWECQGT